MSDEPDKPDGKRLGLKIWAWIVPLILLAYVLSCGPIMDGLNGTAPESLPRRIFVVVYRPLLFTVAHAPRWISDSLWWLASVL
jgi:hypothetical protein